MKGKSRGCRYEGNQIPRNGKSAGARAEALVGICRPRRESPSIKRAFPPLKRWALIWRPCRAWSVVGSGSVDVPGCSAHPFASQKDGSPGNHPKAAFLSGPQRMSHTFVKSILTSDFSAMMTDSSFALGEGESPEVARHLFQSAVYGNLLRTKFPKLATEISGLVSTVRLPT